MWGVEVVAFVLAVAGSLMLLAGVTGLALWIYAIDHAPLVDTSLAMGLAAAGPAALVPLSVWALLVVLLRTQAQNEAILRELKIAQILETNPRANMPAGLRPQAPGDPMVKVRPMPPPAAAGPVEPDEAVVSTRPNYLNPPAGPMETVAVGRPVDPNLLRFWEQATAEKPAAVVESYVSPVAPVAEETAEPLQRVVAGQTGEMPELDPPETPPAPDFPSNHEYPPGSYLVPGQPDSDRPIRHVPLPTDSR